MKMEKHFEFLSVLGSLVLTDEQNHSAHLWALPRSPLSFASHSIVPSYECRQACPHKGRRRGTLKKQQQLALLFCGLGLGPLSCVHAVELLLWKS